MNLALSGGPNVKALLSAANTAALIEALHANLLLAGWTDLFPIGAFSTGTWSAQPANGSIVSWDTKGVTFKTTLNQSADGDVQIGADLATTLGNLKAAINLEAGAGTKYSTATTIHPNVACESVSATQAVMRWKTAGSAGNGKSIWPGGTHNSTWVPGSNAPFSIGSFYSGGYYMLTAKTPQQQQCSLYFYMGGSSDTYVTFLLLDRIGSNVGAAATGFSISVSAGFEELLIACPYQLCLLAPGIYNGANSAARFLIGGVPWLPEDVKPFVITAATNASPIACTTDRDHGLVDGQQVYIKYGTGCPAINGTRAVTVTGTNSFTLNGSAGDGTYDANSAVCAGPDQIAEVAWLTSNSDDDIFNNRPCFRINSYNAGRQKVHCDGASWGGNAIGGIGTIRVSGPHSAYPTEASGRRFADGTNLDWLPWLNWGRFAYTEEAVCHGGMWDAFCVNQSYTVDIEEPNIAGYRWRQITAFTGGGTPISFWLLIPD